LFEATALTTVDIKMTLGHFICTVVIIMKPTRQKQSDNNNNLEVLSDLKDKIYYDKMEYENYNPLAAVACLAHGLSLLATYY
jgi:hypothetical protein